MMYQYTGLVIRLTGLSLVALSLLLIGLDLLAEIPAAEPWLREFSWPSRTIALVFGGYLWHVGRHYVANIFSEI